MGGDDDVHGEDADNEDGVDHDNHASPEGGTDGREDVEPAWDNAAEVDSSDVVATDRTDMLLPLLLEGMKIHS